MNEHETKQQTDEASPESVNETDPTIESSAPAEHKEGQRSNAKGYVAAAVIVVLIILGALYLLEKEGRSSTSIFSSVLEGQEAGAVVAVVNGEEIVSADLDTSIEQFEQAASAQGVDITSSTTQSEIERQALDVIINTTLLKQAAAEQGMEVTDEAVTERITTIESEVGGADALATRMSELGLTKPELRTDIRDELLIQKLLDGVFAEADIVVTEEEIAEVYANAGGEEAGLPALEEVREQVEQQVVASKEQAAVDEYLNELKKTAEINIVGK